MEPNVYYDVFLYQWNAVCGKIRQMLTNFGLFLLLVNTIGSVDTLNTILFATFCSDLTAKVKIFNKRMYLVE